MNDGEKMKEQVLALIYAGDFAQAEEKIKSFLQREPQNAELMGFLAGIYIEKQKFSLSQVWIQKALQTDSSYIFAYFLQARIYNEQCEWLKAIEKIKWMESVYQGRINDEILTLMYNLLGHIYAILGNAQLAAQYSLKASQCGVQFFQRIENYSNYLFNLNYIADTSDVFIFYEHQQYNQFFENIKQYTHEKEHAHKKIRLGYISPDFRHHVVCYFIYQLLKRYNKEHFEVICYSLGKPDHVTCHLKSLVDEWQDISYLSNQEAAERIYRDEIDILVDFSGHTKNNALPILAYKPAPIQISGIGYFNTTGLKAVDYFLTDIYVDPVGQNDELFTEKLLRLPHSHFCYTPPSFMPEVIGDAPFKRNGYITFGSFNHFTKTTDEVLRVWQKILSKVNGAKLVLKSKVFMHEDTKKNILDRLYRVGFTASQLDLRPETMPYLDEYNDIDIALDTFPYPGGGTSCEALYMGVPLISLAGNRHGSRFGYSLLKNIGLEECIAFSKEAYVQKAVDLASQPQRIAELRKNLRGQMQNSPLMDGVGYVQAIEEFYQRIWIDYLKQFLAEDESQLKLAAIRSMQTNRYYHVLSAADKILTVNPMSCEALHAKALAYMHLGCYDKSVSYVRKIIEINERYIGGYITLAYVYKKENLVKMEIELLETVIRLLDSIEPNEWSEQDKNAYAEAWSMLGSAYLLCGDIEKAMSCYQKSSTIEEDLNRKIQEYSNFLFASNYIASLSNKERLAIHCEYQKLFAEVKRYPHSFPQAKAKLRIGYISPDFHRHPVVYFSLAMFAHFNRDRFTVIGYYNGKPDGITTQIKELLTDWRQIDHLDADAAAKLINDDQIDLLIDLSGHTANSCLPILARKPAPIQLCGIGYFHSTGLAEVDYFIGDKYCDDANEQQNFIEKIIKLPNSHFCYCAGSLFPEISLLPSNKKDHITFGSFNNFAKVTDEVLIVWQQILRQVKNSRLILKSKGFSSQDVCDEVYRRLINVGIHVERVELRPFTEKHLQEYADIDIALDSFPYTGGATTCEALYMGVPVITLCGNRHGSKFGYSILKNIGLDDWIAYDKKEYIEKTVAFAKNLPLLEKIRKTLRKQMQESTLMNQQQYMKELENKYEEIWQIHIEKNRAKQIDEICSLWEKHQIEQAVEKAMDLYKLDSNHPLTTYTMGFVLYNIGEKEMAEKILKKDKSDDADIKQLLRQINQA